MLWYASLCGNRPWDCILCGEAYEKALWLASLLKSGCVGYVLCGEADEEALWLASLLKSGCGCVGTVLCGEADEEALWLASLCGVGVLKSTFLFRGEDLTGIFPVKSSNPSLYEDLTA